MNLLYMNINQVILIILSFGVGILVGRLSMKDYNSNNNKKKNKVLDKTIKSIQDIKSTIEKIK